MNLNRLISFFNRQFATLLPVFILTKSYILYRLLFLFSNHSLFNFAEGNLFFYNNLLHQRAGLCPCTPQALKSLTKLLTGFATIQLHFFANRRFAAALYSLFFIIYLLCTLRDTSRQLSSTFCECCCYPQRIRPANPY